MIEGFRLSPQQARLWSLQQDSRAYRLQCAILLEGPLKREVLREALEKIVARHTILRAAFHRRPGMTTPLQVMNDGHCLNWSERDLSDLSPDEHEARIADLFQPEAFSLFDFERGPLFHSTLLALSERKHMLVLSLPAICADSRTAGNIFKELGRWYAGQNDDPDEEPTQYIQFAEWQNELIKDEAEKDGKQFWRSRQMDSLSTLRAPFEIRSCAETVFNPQCHVLSFEPDVLSKLDSLAQRRSTSISPILLASWQTLLWRLMGRTDFLIGAGFDGRKYDELKDALGLFATYVPLECRFEERLQFSEALGTVTESVRDAFAWQEYFAWPAEQDSVSNSEGVSFFPVQFDFEERPPGYEAGGVSFSLHKQYSCVERFKVKLVCARLGSRLTAEFQYDPSYIKSASIRILAGYFESLLRSALEHPESLISELEILTETDRQQLTVDFNGVSRSYPKDRCLHQLFEQQAGRSPDCIAVVFERQQVSYGELNRKANQLAHYLIERGIEPCSTVGLCLERSVEMVIGVLGILKAGGAYLPLDPELPKTRIEYQISEAGSKLLITQASLLERLPGFPCETVLLSGIGSPIERMPSDNPAIEIAPQSLAYVIYTSGSMGLPKGVAIAHQNLVNYVYSLSYRLQLLEPPDGLRLSFATVSTIAADLGNSAIFPSLVSGGCLHVISYDTATDGNKLARYFSEHAIDVLKIVPSHLSALMAEVDGLLPRKYLILGGEALSFEFASQIALICGGTRIVNHYGPTETTIGSLTYDFSEHGGLPRMGSNVPIGRPIANTEIYILDHHLNPAPLGVAGELYIGGDGTAQYYLNKAEQTAERFVPNPYSPRTRLYRTGDLARFLPDGSVEFLGRVDNQVKIHGYRIELGEIEAVLSSHPCVRDAAIIAREDETGRKRLVAYFVASEPSINSAELQTFLRQKLPVYMIPSAMVALKTMPLTPNGKLDRHRLPAPGSHRADEESGFCFVAPRTNAERTLAQIWKDILRIERVGVHDNFFELGGDSILSLQIVARANRANIKLTHKQLFERPTIAALAEVARQDEAVEISQKAVSGAVPLTPIQHWFFEQNLDDPHHWNMGILLEVWPRCEAALIEQAVRALVRHHDALRLRFIRGESGWQQTNVALDEEGNFSSIDLSALPDHLQAEAIESNAAELQQSLNLSEGPLFRVALLGLGADKAARLVIIVHHLVIDGVSWRILLNDLESVYEQLSTGEAVEFPPKTTSFKQWAEALSKHARSSRLRQELAHWLIEPRAEIAGLKPDYSDGVALNTESSARSVVTSLAREDTRALLQDVPGVYHTRINDVLLTALVQAFSKVTGERSMLVDLEGHGREPISPEIDLSRTVGWFTTHFPVLLDLSWSSNVGDALKIVKEQLRRVPDHGIGWGVLRYMTADAKLTERLSALPRPEVSFNYLGQFESGGPESQFKQARELPGPDKSPRGSRAHLLRINASVREGELEVNWGYSLNVHERPTIVKLAGHFMDALREIVAHCHAPESGGYTPSDFSEPGLNQNDIDVVIASLRHGEGSKARDEENAEDMYSLSPLQEGMLFHSLTSPRSDAYFRQFSFAIKGTLNVEALERAWLQVISRHPALRTSFFWQGVRKPLQMVHKRVILNMEQRDWRDLTPSQQAGQLEDFSLAERERGFDLSKPPLMRLALIRMGDDSYRFVWSYHHLVMDAWSRASLYREVLSLYEATRQGLDSRLGPTHPYGEYIAWLRAQDRSKADIFWRKMLKGFTARTRIGGAATDDEREYENKMAAEEIRLTATATSALRSFAQQQKLTLNTLVQGAWSLLLSCYSGQQDIAFGTVVSGRPAELKGVESIVGAFINTLVMRVQVPISARLLSWLKEIQLLQLEMSQYEFSQLVEAQRCSDVPRGTPLFDSVLNFANHPPFASTESPGSALEIADVRFSEDNPYPLVVQASPGPELSLRITYNGRRFDAQFIKGMLARMLQLLESFAENPERRLRDLMFFKDDIGVLSDESSDNQDANDVDAQFVF